MDELGFYGLSFSEHIAVPSGEAAKAIGDTWPDVLVLAAWLAGQTERLRLVDYCLVVPYRNPVVLAKQIATLDAVSGGRTQICVGAGWFEEEFSILGVPFEDRGGRLDEYLAAMIELWTSDHPTYKGKYVSFDDVLFAPRPVQKPHPTLLVAGSGKRVLNRALELGLGWAPMVGTVDELRRDISWLKEQSAARGNDPASLEFMYNLQVGQGDDAVKEAYAHSGTEGDEQPSTGDTDNLTQTAIDTLREYADAGITQMMLIFGWHKADDYIENLEWLARDVIPQVKDGAK
jgi:probable F420-dependent oxidoreductase